ncbi:MAG: hypothetical protein WBN50_13165 [Lutimonas sp.]
MNKKRIEIHFRLTGGHRRFDAVTSQIRRSHIADSTKSNQRFSGAESKPAEILVSG